MNRAKMTTPILFTIALGILGGRIDAVRADSNFDLLMAAVKGDLAAVKVLTAKGAAINHSCGGLTPLIAAAAKGQLDIVKHLLAEGADVNNKSRQGPTALMQAAAAGNVEMVRLLLEQGADVNAEATYIWTDLPLTGVDCVDLERLAAVEDLCEGEKCCMTALCVAATPEIAKLLKQHGAVE
ncbi:MAG: ankyrin repeat domain-containing protein [Desulfomonilaceae bacterium]|nr:ankyrin repeat domain-containing protein [Desulfomonilaceae bacterium]